MEDFRIICCYGKLYKQKIALFFVRDGRVNYYYDITFTIMESGALCVERRYISNELNMEKEKKMARETLKEKLQRSITNDFQKDRKSLKYHYPFFGGLKNG